VENKTSGSFTPTPTPKCRAEIFKNKRTDRFRTTLPRFCSRSTRTIGHVHGDLPTASHRAKEQLRKFEWPMDLLKGGTYMIRRKLTRRTSETNRTRERLMKSGDVFGVSGVRALPHLPLCEWFTDTAAAQCDSLASGPPTSPLQRQQQIR
jgi:hypothetical protein